MIRTDGSDRTDGAFNPGIVSVLVSSAPDGIVLVDRQGLIQYANPHVTELLGFEVAKLVGESLDVLGVAAHDLRNPLSAVMAYSEMMLAGLVGPLSSEQKQPVTTILQSAEFMHSLVSDLLSLSKIEEGSLELHRDATELAELVELCIKLQQPFADRKVIRLDVGLTRPAVAVADARKVEQVVQNLLSNAVKFSHRNSTVTVRLSADAGGWLFEVADEGVGIPADEHHLVLKPFSTTSARPTGGEQSTGLGLSICAQIGEGHGGTLEFESQPGEGATFRVWLPSHAPDPVD
jgi:signal transduction histidine kinase